jgi:hypothetical protein
MIIVKKKFVMDVNVLAFIIYNLLAHTREHIGLGVRTKGQQ